MTDQGMILIELVAKEADGDLVREMLSFRNALAHALAKSRTAVAAMLKTIFAQETKAEAEAQWDAVADARREKTSKLGAMMDASRDDVLAYMAFPKEHWAQISSTNPLERVNKEIKRRSDVVGIFPNDDAIIRLVGALMLEQNDEWAVDRRYMALAACPSHRSGGSSSSTPRRRSACRRP